MMGNPPGIRMNAILQHQCTVAEHAFKDEGVKRRLVLPREVRSKSVKRLQGELPLSRNGLPRTRDYSY